MPHDTKSSSAQRAATALANPLFAIDLVREAVMTRVWSALFRVHCWLSRVEVGSGVVAYGACIIRKAPRSTIRLGNGVVIVSSSWRSSTANCHRSKLRTYYPSASIIFEDRSGMTGGSIIARSKTIRIGAGCMLAPNVTILDSDFHILWPPERRNDTWETDIDAGVTLEKNVWVGMGATILKGVTIGENSVIAAGSVVVTSIPANSLAGGNPAKVIKALGAQ